MRARESAKLLDWGLLNFETPRVFNAGQELLKAPVYKGAAPEVTVGLMTDRYVSVPRGKVGEIRQEVSLRKPLIAPLAAGQEIGVMRLTLDGQALAEYPLSVMQAVEKGSWWRRLIDTIRLWFA